MNIAEGNSGKDTTVRLIQEQHKQDSHLYIEITVAAAIRNQAQNLKVESLKNQLGYPLVILAWIHGISTLSHKCSTLLSKSGFVSADTNPNSERGQGQPNSDLKVKENPLWFYHKMRFKREEDKDPEFGIR
ncbi:hypothetical protein VNO78_03114 [Psophocarpus tetragonolobus]|uniref:Uncharacterized protein n=1 Tax=Psophocarpus tetragonolobus TaxID=3891 RepID=A0AAN9XVU5_PSOTE